MSSGSWHASGKQNIMRRRQCVKTIERTSTKVCCSGHMLQCLISRSGETWLSEKKMMNTFTLGNLLQWRMTFQGKRTEELGLRGEHMGGMQTQARIAGRCAFKWKTFNQWIWLVLTYGSEKWVLIWKTGRRLTVVQVVTGWLILWVTNRERIYNSFSWATDSKEQCNLEKYRIWNDPGQVTWFYEKMTDRTSWWSNGSRRDVLGREEPAEAKGSDGATQKWLRLRMNIVHMEGKWHDV